MTEVIANKTEPSAVGSPARLKETTGENTPEEAFISLVGGGACNE